MKARVGVIIPCLNEAEPIADVVRDVLAQGVHEVIVVDNGSTDATAAIAAAAGARVVSEPRRGYGRACAAGVAALDATTEIACFIDGDGSDVPGFIAQVVAPIAAGGADFVMGSRLRGKREPGSLTPQQVLAGRIAGMLLRGAYGVRFTDMSPLRAMRADVNYYLSFDDAAEIPKDRRADIAMLLRDGYFMLHPDLTMKPGRPFSRAKPHRDSDRRIFVGCSSSILAIGKR